MLVAAAGLGYACLTRYPRSGTEVGRHLPPMAHKLRQPEGALRRMYWRVWEMPWDQHLATVPNGARRLKVRRTQGREWQGHATRPCNRNGQWTTVSKKLRSGRGSGGCQGLLLIPPPPRDTAQSSETETVRGLVGKGRGCRESGGSRW